MLCNTKAIVFQSIKYGESSCIIKTYTEKFGKQSFLVHGVRKKKSKINAYLLQPFSLIEIIAYIKETRDLHKIKEIKPFVFLKTIHFDIRKSSIALFLSEIINRTLHEVEPNNQLFDYLNHAIQILDISNEGIENFHLIFLMQFTKFLGIFPKNNVDLKKYNSPNSFPIENLLDISLTDTKKLRIDNPSRSELLDQLLHYYHDHIEGMNKIKSLDVLRNVFAT
ncbi:MAG: DNA repair protein RecO [Bacteroidales bacterium]|nr:DNA repair protein RecO [Bacteroidales bacterium]